MQVVFLNMDEHKDELLLLFSLSDADCNSHIASEKCLLSFYIQSWILFQVGKDMKSGGSDFMLSNWWGGQQDKFENIILALFNKYAYLEVNSLGDLVDKSIQKEDLSSLLKSPSYIWRCLYDEDKDGNQTKLHLHYSNNNFDPAIKHNPTIQSISSTLKSPELFKIFDGVVSTKSPLGKLPHAIVSPPPSKKVKTSTGSGSVCNEDSLRSPTTSSSRPRREVKKRQYLKEEGTGIPLLPPTMKTKKTTIAPKKPKVSVPSFATTSNPRNNYHQRKNMGRKR